MGGDQPIVSIFPALCRLSHQLKIRRIRCTICETLRVAARAEGTPNRVGSPWAKMYFINGRLDACEGFLDRTEVPVSFPFSIHALGLRDYPVNTLPQWLLSRMLGCDKPASKRLLLAYRRTHGEMCDPVHGTDLDLSKLSDEPAL